MSAPPSVHRVPFALLAAAFACFIAMLGLTFVDGYEAAPALVGGLGFILLLTAILSLRD